MSEENKEAFGDTVLGGSIGIGILILCCCLGVGSCNAIQAVATCHHDEEAEVVQPDAKTQTEAIAIDAMSTIAVEDYE